ncbi:hypothetical protein D7X33_35900 [Butyricicoccus sp. 1XD8-22]|nr:hypothetical protein D7X33_35900 [Butyricicoccus sp. 1XD8-22]
MFDKLKKSLFGKSHRRYSYSSSHRGYSHRDKYYGHKHYKRKRRSFSSGFFGSRSRSFFSS